MDSIKKPSALPHSKIINALIRQSNLKADYEFDYIAKLDDLRNRISQEVSRINLLFPEYTPHDEAYHLKRLFFVADDVLENSVIDNLNATELFLLAASLYGHDWGMAVSEEEKKMILDGHSGICGTNYCLLDDEKIRLDKFCKSRGISISEFQLEDWQEYVRRTHAFRSGKRIRAYFENINTGLGDFAARICEGHWLNFDIIDDSSSYPTNASLLREIVNLKALTLYVRLIDLLDIGEDRTPYVLWKFVAPHNKFSKMEWAKHRAIHPITIPPYQNGRYIQIDGSTDDHYVYMSIMDLKRYIDEQFRQCSDLLNRMSSEYYKLNIYHIDWRIAARGFEPIPIQFEFDRKRMFDILSDDIYKGNPYVFIRELLQNSIDAISMRLEILENVGLSFNPLIKITAKDETDFVDFTISDNGIGMDEYIVKNYLAVAGKSYYKSADFEKEGLKMDPISRFGIGVLSCFMLSEQIELTTSKDSNFGDVKTDPLKISIPEKENFFKIEKLANTIAVGTQFKVLVLKNKLPKNETTQQAISLEISEYIKKLAGFVKYPILVEENERKLYIIHPDSPRPKDASIDCFQSDYHFPFEKVIQPQNIDTAKKYFTEEIIRLKEDLNMIDHDGCITFLVPKSDNLDIFNERGFLDNQKTTVIDLNDNLVKETIQWFHHWIRDYDREDQATERHKRYYQVYLDGVLVENISPPSIKSMGEDIIYQNASSFLPAKWLINIPKPNGMKIDLARTNIKSVEPWDKKIWEALLKYLRDKLINALKSKSPKEELISIVRIMTYYGIPSHIITTKLLSVTDVPFTIITSDGDIKAKSNSSGLPNTINIFPTGFDREVNNAITDYFITSGKCYNGILKNWNGLESVTLLVNTFYFESPYTIKNIHGITFNIIRSNYYLHRVQFVKAPKGTNYPLAQEIRMLKSKSDSKDLEVNYFIERIKDIEESQEISLLNALVQSYISDFPEIVIFCKPYETKFGYSIRYLNFSHPTVQHIIFIILTLLKNIESKTISPILSGQIFDLITNLSIMRKSSLLDKNIDISSLDSQLSVLFTEVNKIGIQSSNINVSITEKDFVENSLQIGLGGLFSMYTDIQMNVQSNEKWGMPLA